MKYLPKSALHNDVCGCTSVHLHPDPSTNGGNTPTRQTTIGVFDTTLCDKVCQWLAIGRWFPPPIESGVKHHSPNHNLICCMKYLPKSALHNDVCGCTSVHLHPDPSTNGGNTPTRQTTMANTIHSFIVTWIR